MARELKPEDGTYKFRQKTLEAFGDLLNETAHAPSLRPEEIARVMALLPYLEEFTKKLIKIVTFSNPGYEERDLTQWEKDVLKTMEHNVRILQALYGPQAG